MYDEQEYFKKYNDEEFFYPYQMRKTKLGSFSFNILIDEETYDYDYFSKQVSFYSSQICLEGPPLNFADDFIESISETIGNIAEWLSGEDEDEQLDKVGEFLSECNNDQFNKLVYLKNKDTLKNYLDDYEKAFFDDKMLLEVILKLDPVKKEIERGSSNVLDFLGDLGGFKEALDIIVVGTATFFSSKFFIASIASKFYFTRADPTASKKKQGVELKKKIEKTGLYKLSASTKMKLPFDFEMKNDKPKMRIDFDKLAV